MGALVEAHDADELARALRAGARIVGVNNRNLHDFTVEEHRSVRLARTVCEDVAFVAESGVQTPADVRGLTAAGVDAVLVGEALMRKSERAVFVAELRAQAACGEQPGIQTTTDGQGVPDDAH